MSSLAAVLRDAAADVLANASPSPSDYVRGFSDGVVFAAEKIEDAATPKLCCEHCPAQGGGCGVCSSPVSRVERELARREKP